MKISSNRINGLSEAIRQKRLAMGLEVEKLADELGVPPEVIKMIETSEWSIVPSDSEYPSIILITERLDFDLRNYSGAFSVEDAEKEGIRPSNLKAERIVMIAMTAAATAMLAWLVIPAKSIAQPNNNENQEKVRSSVFWQKPVTDQPYPVLGEVFPESPITKDGVLISLRATDTCNARIVMENGQEQSQVLRMSEPWQLRVKGAFVLYLDNADLVAVEVAGQKIQHGAGVGKLWVGSFDAQGNWKRPRLPTPPVAPQDEPDDDDDIIPAPV